MIFPIFFALIIIATASREIEMPEEIEGHAANGLWLAFLEKVLNFF